MGPSCFRPSETLAVRDTDGTRISLRLCLAPWLRRLQLSGRGLYQLDRSFGSGVMAQMMAQGAEKVRPVPLRPMNFRRARRFKGMKTGSIAGYDMLRANPEQWALETVLSLLKSHGFDID